MSEIDLLKRCRLTPEAYEATRRVESSVRRKRRQRFVKFPELWIERLRGARHTSTFHVAFRVLQKHSLHKGQPFPLPNNIEGVSRWAKWVALSELEERGLIRQERRRRKSPLVVVVDDTSVEDRRVGP